MSDTTTTTDPLSAARPDAPTQEVFVAGDAAHHPAPDAAAGGPGDPPWDDSATDDDAWPERGPRRGVRIPVPTAVLLALLIAAGGIWGGAALQRSHGTTSGASSAASSLASLFGGRGATGGAAGTGAAGAFGAATSGTVTEVSGSTLYVTDATGALVKVTLSPSATVTRNAASNLASLQVGDTVVVRGTKTGSAVSATSVSATGAGVTSPFSGFGGRGAAAAG